MCGDCSSQYLEARKERHARFARCSAGSDRNEKSDEAQHRAPRVSWVGVSAKLMVTVQQGPLKTLDLDVSC